MSLWYSRPVLFAADVPKAVDFYISKLGFSEKWRYTDQGAQVERDECEIIVSNQRLPEGVSMLFIELTPADHAALPGFLTNNGVAFTLGRWGYPVIIVEDLDGNQLYFPDPTDPGSSLDR